MDVQGHQRALPGPATRHDEVDSFRIQQDAGHDAQVNIGQMVIVLVTHPDVIDRESLLIDDGF
ncbi:hypothetical protein D3C87_1787800 [compost metagenome]